MSLELCRRLLARPWGLLGGGLLRRLRLRLRLRLLRSRLRREPHLRWRLLLSRLLPTMLWPLQLLGLHLNEGMTPLGKIRSESEQLLLLLLLLLLKPLLLLSVHSIPQGIEGKGLRQSLSLLHVPQHLLQSRSDCPFWALITTKPRTRFARAHVARRQHAHAPWSGSERPPL